MTSSDLPTTAEDVAQIEADSTLGDDNFSSLNSLNSEVTKFEYSNGRRYHSFKAGRYDLPNDELEQDRLDLQHGIWLEALDGKLQCAPISGDVQDILDIATGTGNWVIDTADAHPSARIIGVDLRIPPNCEFEVDDAEADWTYHHKFDFIHGRLLSIGWRDWDKLCRQSFRFLKPSGWVEYQEYTWPMICACAPNTHPPSLITEYCTHVVDAASKRNIHMQTPSTLTSRLKAAGFINIHVKEFPWYVSEPKIKKAALQGLEGIALRLFTERLGWSKERMMVYLTQVRKAFMEETERHIYVPMWVVYGQKPSSDLNLEALPPPLRQ